MTLSELLSLGMQYGHPYQVTIQTPCDETPSAETLFFAGFRIKNARNTADDATDIVPIFNLPNRSGKMGRHRREGLSTFLEFIHDIQPLETIHGVDDTGIPSSVDEAASLARTIGNTNNAALNALRILLTEIGILFPGRAVRLDDGNNPIGCTLYGKHGVKGCTILAVRADDNHDIVFDVQTDDGDTDFGLGEEDVAPQNYAYLLAEVMRCIAKPRFPREQDDVTIETFIGDGTAPEDIPSVDEPADASRYPALRRSLLLDELRGNIWFAHLTDTAKIEVSSRTRDRKGNTPFTDVSSAEQHWYYDADKTAKYWVYQQEKRKR